MAAKLVEMDALIEKIVAALNAESGEGCVWKYTAPLAQSTACVANNNNKHAYAGTTDSFTHL
jgi:hypothetical protein